MKVFMRRIAFALIVVGAVAIAAILPSVIESEPSWEERAIELERTYPFISVHDGGGYYSQSIDKDAAEKAGISKRTVLLAYEILDYQNRLVFEEYRSEILGIPMAEVDLREFPKAEEFLEEATKKAEEEEKETEERRIDGLARLQIGPFRIGGASEVNAHSILGYTAPPCGNFIHPIPSQNLPFSIVPHDDPRNALLGAGFHMTSPDRACADRDCSNDYTRSRSYESDHGICQSPLFRDHGWVYTGEASYSIQRGEPNPESGFMDSDIWPNPFWKYYVGWWHSRY